MLKLLGIVVACAACGSTGPEPVRTIVPVKPAQASKPAAAVAKKPEPKGHPNSYLIPRDVFFSPPARTKVEISPDGARLSWLADGKLWVAPVANLSDAHALTDAHEKYTWVETSQQLVYLGDDDHLYRLDLDGTSTDITPYAGARAHLFRRRSVKGPATVIVKIDDRDRNHPDLYYVDVTTGKRSLLFENDEGFDNVMLDQHDRPRVAAKMGHDWQQFALEGKTWKLFDTIPFADQAETTVWGIGSDDKSIVMFDSRVGDTGALVSMDFRTGKKTLLASDPKSAALSLWFENGGFKLLAVKFGYQRPTVTALDPASREDLDAIAKLTTGGYSIIGWAAHAWLVNTYSTDRPDDIYLFDLKSKTSTLLFSSRPKSEGHKLAPITPIEIPTRDGLTLVGSVTRPLGKSQPGPMVLRVFDGGWGHQLAGVSPTTMFLADRGYTVLMINLRGSGGLGRAFFLAGKDEQGKKVVDDAIDALRWAEKQGIVAPHQTCIMGEGMSGHTALSALEVEPDAFACGIGLDAPVDLTTELASRSDGPERANIGDPTTAEGKAKLQSISLMKHVDAITKPMFVVGGELSTKVPFAELREFADSVRERGIPVLHGVFYGQRDPLKLERNRGFAAMALEQFLSMYLGGEYLPPTSGEIDAAHMGIKFND
ncbi:MAG: prolyl oligopeptidase family serine peptidase [Kofleriaceae bacterium]